MVSFATLLSFVFLAVSVSADPFAPSSKFATHRTRVLPRGLTLETYHPATTYNTFGEGKELPSSLTKRSLEDTTVGFVASELGVDADSIAFTSGYSADSQTVAYVKQVHDGIEFLNAVANVALKDNKVVAFGASFVDTADIASSTPTIDVNSVIADVEEQLDGTFNGYTALNYLSKADGSVALTHAIQVQNEEVNSWFEVYVDAHSGEILSVVDFVADLTYTVTPIQKDAVTEGQEVLVNPEIAASSPSGWVTTNTTAGNNVISYKSSQSAVTTVSSSGTFNYPYNTSLAPTETINVNAARVNAFYIINALHDILYLYGWTEASYNFQIDNFGKGGSGNDRVLMSVQDSSGTNNANFATPRDGSSGTCRMYVWTYTTPRRDGDLQNDIIVHEYTHGLTNRMTGGGTGSCLQTTQAGGMGEGWSDIMAAWTEQKSATVLDYTMAAWVINDSGGIRSYPYSTSASVNPLRYSNIRTLTEVHAIGEVWANILYNVYAALVSTHGWSATARTSATGTQGNVVWLHLLIDALALQPCNPTVLQARDAWIQADANRYAGANKCTLWTAFASRGLGTGATSAFADSSAVPSDC